MATPSSSQSKRGVREKGGSSTEQSGTESRGARAPDPATWHAMIAEAAYYRAERRGFAPGFELEDWLLSEAELGAQNLEKTESELH